MRFRVKGEPDRPYEVWYRFEEYVSASYDSENDTVGFSTVHIQLFSYPVTKYTPKGAILAVGYPRFVRRDARKRFACPTIEEAKESFLARKRRQAGIHEARARIARKAIDIMKADKWKRAFT
jgi:hypothetical protein